MLAVLRLGVTGRLPAVTEGTAARSQPPQTEWSPNEGDRDLGGRRYHLARVSTPSGAPVAVIGEANRLISTCRKHSATHLT